MQMQISEKHANVTTVSAIYQIYYTVHNILVFCVHRISHFAKIAH